MKRLLVPGPVGWNDAVKYALLYFFCHLLVLIFRSYSMFQKRHAWRHRLCGMLLLLWFLFGIAKTSLSYGGPPRVSTAPPLTYDLCLGALGVLTTFSAALDFKKSHSSVENKASGTLDKDATVTYSEMVEHGFYQIINVVQIFYLHMVGDHSHLLSVPQALVMALAATSPWVFRGSFPVNRFSDNYTKGQKASSLISILYRAKKYQYIFYKHFLLHGLNASVALDLLNIASLQYFRWYWLCLNISYVMEFFLQTMVKKNYMSQQQMLLLQQILMLASTISAVRVVLHVRMLPACLSLFLNFVRRKRDFTNFIICLFVSRLVQQRPHFLVPALMGVCCVAIGDSIVESMFEDTSQDQQMKKVPKTRDKKTKGKKKSE